MIYQEIDTKINYSRENLHWNAWGAIDQDFFHISKIQHILEYLSTTLEMSSLPNTPSVEIEDLKIPKSKITPSDKRAIVAKLNPHGNKKVINSRHEIVLHSVGRSYYDVIRLRTNKIKNFVDLVIYPHNLKDIEQVLKWAMLKKIAIVPFGGGSSVVGGLEAIKTKGQKAVISLDLTRLDKLIEINETDRTATFEAGIYGPKLEQALNAKGYTLGHFPQSFEYSTLGGWVAARSAGQQSNKYGSIETLVANLEIITPAGVIKSLDFNHIANGPDTNQIFTGSEGLLGIITQVKVKVSRLPKERTYFAFMVESFLLGCELVKNISQNNIPVSMARLSDEAETIQFETLASLGKDTSKVKSIIQDLVLKKKNLYHSRCLLIIGLEGDKHITAFHKKSIQFLAKTYGALYLGEKAGKNWLKGRFNMPFLRNHLLDYGIAVDTLETSCNYSKAKIVHKEVVQALKKATGGTVLCHLSHSYHDGACLYFTVIYEMDLKNPIKQWQKLKKDASDVLIKNGVSMSHHHGIGVDHKPWYQKQLSPALLKSLKQIKKTLDVKNIMNPGKLFD